MKLGLGLRYSSMPAAGTLELVVEAERLGFDSLWTAEAYGTDALTPLAWYGSHTSRIRLATGICQLPARTPTAMAMAAMTLDHLSGGRFILGLGASGPQVVEGWYGQPYPKPLGRTREYVEIIRRVVAREAPVTYSGQHYSLPYSGGAGVGKALKTTVHPQRSDLPIFLGAEGPKNIALAGEIADGWVAVFYTPREDAWYRARLEEGFARRDPSLRPSSEFEVTCLVPVVIDPDVEAAADAVRPWLALYAGGMGARGVNFHIEAMGRMGYEAECLRIQDLYLDGKKEEAAAVVPTKMVEDFALIGPPEKIRDDLESWNAGVISTLIIGGTTPLGGPAPLLPSLAELVLS